MHSLHSVLTAAFIALILPAPLEAATLSATASCKSIFDAGGTTYAAFTGCFVNAATNSFNDTTFGTNDRFSDHNNGEAGVETLVDLLFTDTTSVIGSGTFSPGPGDGGEEFAETRESSGFIISDGGIGSLSVTISGLPTGTSFVSLKYANGYDLFGLYGSTSPFTFMSSAGAISHISTFAVTPVPVPAAGLLLLGGLGGLAALRRRRGRTSQR